MIIRERLVVAGVKELTESGHPTCNEENILTHPPYKKLFIPFLKDNKGHSKEVNSEIDKLIAECKSASATTTKRYRTIFPNSVNFSGWYLLSKKNCIAQLVKNGRNLHEHILYVLQYQNGQIGFGQFTAEDLIEGGVQYICPTREDLPIEDETKVH
jgi:hypothetical protein